MARILVREALPSDKGPVLEFCKNTWPGGDYIEDVWDEWMRGPGGSLQVATIQDKPIGLGHARLQTRTVVWLEGLRVHPSFRGQGIAGQINRVLLSYAKGKGASVARLSTGKQNKASRRHLAKVGFKMLQRFDRLDSKTSLHSRIGNVSRVRKYRLGLWSMLRNSDEFTDFKGLYSEGWTWNPLTLQALRHHCRQRNVLVTNSGGEISSLAIVSPDGDRVTLGFLTASEDKAVDFGKYLREWLDDRRFRHVRALIPHGSLLARGLIKAGFKQTGSILVFERSL